MDPQQLQVQFRKFLIDEKGYPSQSLLPDAWIPEGGKLDPELYLIDLVILDIQFNNYFCSISLSSILVSLLSPPIVIFITKVHKDDTPSLYFYPKHTLFEAVETREK